MEKGMPILLVEDDVVDIKTIQKALNENNICNPLYVTGNGEEALRFLRSEGEYSEPGKSPRPGIILLDLNMPVMGGLEFLEQIKNNGNLKRIPVIVLTTSKEDSDMVKSYDLSVAGYVIKPVDFDKFLEVVKVINLYWELCELAPRDNRY
ncbi:MAG: response regulator [bacterium]|nr:MAG: response regulator [bacterium]